MLRIRPSLLRARSRSGLGFELSDPDESRGPNPAPGQPPATGPEGGQQPSGWPATRPVPELHSFQQPVTGPIGYPPPVPVRPIGKLPSLPVTPRQYHQFWRAPGCGWWRGLVIVALAFVAFALLGVVVVSLAVGIEIGVTGQDMDQALADLAAGRLSAVGIVANSLGIAMLLPVIFLLGLISGQRPGYLSSVVGRIRWGWLWQALLLCSPLFLLFVAFDIWSTDYEFEVRTGTWAFLIALMLVTPLQSAAEEYLVRGLVLRTVGSWIPGPSVAFGISATVSSLVFVSLHASTDLWFNLVYFAFGFAAAYLTWRTGGLEAAVALHVMNNIFAMAIVPFTDWTTLFDRSAGVGSPAVLVQLVPIVGSVLLLEWAARRRQLVYAAGPDAMPPSQIRLNAGQI